MINIIAICIGASAGALLRWQLGIWLNAGGYLIGLLIAAFQAMPQLDPIWRLALITGFLGALTTFSSFSAEVVHMLQTERFAAALSITALHLLGSLALTWLGIKTGMMFFATPAG
jgi:fluoride exporter